VSLTGLLRLPRSATRASILGAFPKIREIARAATWEVAARPTARPPLGSPEWLLGMAFDFRFRAAIAPFDPFESVAALGLADFVPIEDQAPLGPHGCKRSCRMDHVVHETVVGREVIEALFARLAGSPERGRDLDDHDISRACVVLGLLESIYRSGRQPASVLSHRRRASTVPELLALIPDTWASDVTQLVRRAVSIVPLDAPLVLNPVFDGSEDVGGADADFISGDCLLELKVRGKAEVRADDIYQLLGYVLLDYRNVFAIRSVGVYLARQGSHFRWTLDELAGRPVSPNVLARMRRSFRAFVSSDAVWDEMALPRLAAARRPGGPVPRIAPLAVPEELVAYREAAHAAEDQWLAVTRAADAYETASSPTWVYWRRDPLLVAEREATAAVAAAGFTEERDKARELDARAAELERAWLVAGRRRSPSTVLV